MPTNPEFNDGLYVAVSNDGQMTGNEMLRELKEHQICPVMYFEEGGQRIVPLFSRPNIALQFAKRNTPRSFQIGIMETSPRDREKIKADGYVLKEIAWPNKRKCSVHVLFLEQEVETHNMGPVSNAKFFKGTGSG